ncbi:KilA-N domain-containing protein [Nostoc sphaeroides]|uniref:KilA-N domain-containing protein n=1 Tax=Nostoc sphaeroides CCNUC1 TaxID=2653204 RepID=A0A5P8WGA0_9NOSO|nr:KilA-N domain-containing protein [Nostoc sphaeroides]QFS50839.1 KilA-N domain-containing protein [Nostoc sphaeroides CCNUC1]
MQEFSSPSPELVSAAVWEYISTTSPSDRPHSKIRSEKYDFEILDDGIYQNTKAYWTALSNDIGIPMSSLVIEVDGYGSSQGTWIHPEIAVDLAQWVSVEFRIWANRTLMKVMMSQEPVQQQSMTQVQLLAALAQQLAEQEQHLLQQQQQQTEILHRLKAVEVEQDRVNTPCGQKYSVVGFANLQGLEISVKEAGTKGRKASALCRKQGIEIERIHDPRFGQVGLYPESVLIEVFSTGQN